MREVKRQGGPIVDVEVVPELCMNFRNCVRIARGAFLPDPKSGKTRPARWQQVEPDLLWKAAWSCPSGAIRFVTDEGYVVPRWDEVVHWESARHRGAGAKPDQPLEKW